MTDNPYRHGTTTLPMALACSPSIEPLAKLVWAILSFGDDSHLEIRVLANCTGTSPAQVWQALFVLQQEGWIEPRWRLSSPWDERRHMVLMPDDLALP